MIQGPKISAAEFRLYLSGCLLLDAIGQDIRYGCRALRRNPAFTAVVVLTLALGIGANTAVFSVINGVLLEPLPYPRAEELVALRQIAPGEAGLADGLNLSPSMYLTYAEHNRVFESLGVWVATISTVTEAGDPEEVRTIGISDGLLQAFNVPPAAGRWLLAGDQTGAAVPLILVMATVLASYLPARRAASVDPVEALRSE